MERIEQVNDAVRMYVNKAWFPARAVLAPGADANRETATSHGSAARCPSVWGRRAGRARCRPTASFTPALTYSDRWQLDIDGKPVTPRAAFGYAMAFSTTAGTATLRYDTPGSRHEALALQVALWIAVVAVTLFWRDRLRRREAFVRVGRSGEPAP